MSPKTSNGTVIVDLLNELLDEIFKSLEDDDLFNILQKFFQNVYTPSRLIYCSLKNVSLMNSLDP